MSKRSSARSRSKPRQAKEDPPSSPITTPHNMRDDVSPYRGDDNSVGDMCSHCIWCEENRKHKPIPTCRHGRILVSFNPNLFSVVKIDDSSETVTLDIGLTFEWHDPHLAEHVAATNPSARYATHPHILRMEKHDTELWPENHTPGEFFFDPAWKVKGASQTEVLRTITTMRDAASGHVHQFVQCLVTYPLRMHLHDFPFDRQKIKCEILTEHTTRAMQFIPDPERQPKIFYESNSEWSVVHDSENNKGENFLDTNFVDDEHSLETGSGSGRIYAKCDFSFTVQRRSGWYIWNLFLVSFLIVLASFSTFTMKTKERKEPTDAYPTGRFVETQDLANRLQIVFTAWLLLVSLKFVISDRLPKISYLTSLDKYFIYSNGIMLCLVGYFSVLQVRLNDDNHHDFNMDDFIKFPEFVRNLQKYIWGVNSMGPEGIIMLIFVGLWVLLHAQYFIEAVKNFTRNISSKQSKTQK